MFFSYAGLPRAGSLPRFFKHAKHSLRLYARPRVCEGDRQGAASQNLCISLHQIVLRLYNVWSQINTAAAMSSRSWTQRSKPCIVLSRFAPPKDKPA